MFNLLKKIFIKDYNNINNPEVRAKYGVLSGAVGVFFNIVLFAFKFIFGLLCGAVSIVADAFNNLTDAGSSIVTLIGFKISNRPTDKTHPFGHGRMEYVSGFIVSIMMFVVGVELIRTSISKFINPVKPTFSTAVIIVLSVAILVKLYMFYYNFKVSKKINSQSLKATAMDSLNDSVATLLVLFSVIMSKFVSWEIDGICGILVALFIVMSGIKSMLETISLILGKQPEPEYIDEIKKTVLSADGIVGLHDIIVHSYGEGHNIISLHAEIDSKKSLVEAHNFVDNAENMVEKKFGCIAVFHIDPIDINSPERELLLKMIKEIVSDIDKRYTVHDFKVVKETVKTKMYFDVCVPHDHKTPLEEIQKEIEERVGKTDNKFVAFCRVEHSFSDNN